MKYILTLEKYQSYKDFEQSRSKWGTPADIEHEVKMIIGHILTDSISKQIKSLEFDDLSSDSGIKWQITIKGDGTDTIHMYKIDDWRGQYEWYLNKKKTDRNEIESYLQKKYMDNLDIFLQSAKGYDYYADYIDSGRDFKQATDKNTAIEKMFAQLSTADKRTAVKELLKSGAEKQLIDKAFRL